MSRFCCFLLFVTLGLPVQAQGNASFDEIAARYEDANSELRRKAVSEALHFIQIGGDPAPAVALLIRALEDPTQEVQRLAAESLGHMKLEWTPAVVPLTRSLGSPYNDVRAASAGALRSLRAEEARTPLLELALRRKEEAFVRCRAIEALGALPSEHKSLHALIGVAQDESETTRVRGTTLDALGQIRPISREVVAAFRVALREGESGLRRAAAHGLSTLGVAAVPALPDLLATVARDREEPEVVEHAFQALEASGAEAVPFLIAARRDPRAQIRTRADSALLTLGLGLKKDGVVLWWVLPKAHARELLLALILCLAWFVVAAAIPRQRLATEQSRVFQVIGVAALPGLVSGVWISSVTALPWTRAFLPDPVLGVCGVPTLTLVTSILLSAAAARRVCRRKPRELPRISQDSAAKTPMGRE